MCGQHHRITLGHTENTAQVQRRFGSQFVITCSLADAAVKNIRGSDEWEMEIVENSQNAISAHDSRCYIFIITEFISISFFAFDHFSF